MSFLRSLYTRRKKLADVLLDKEYSGIRKIVEDLYPDRAHFIYELLQNAEDAGATEAMFILEADRLIFEHNGRPFNDKDVEGITNIGKGTKGEQEDQIGRFGIGFKAVFAYSDTPHIWSPTYAFKITDMVLPVEIPHHEHIGPKTRFEFPFNNPKKDPKNAYEEIKVGLDELAATTLLFLSGLKLLAWRVDQQEPIKVLSIKHSDHHIEILKQTDEMDDSSAHFLRFSAPVDGLEKQRLAVAFELHFLPKINKFNPQKKLHKQMKIIPATPGRVAVFFPAEKEISGLRFHLHAPFVPELSRASIKETSANEPLLEQLAKLTASSLHKLRDQKLLTGDFLGVLPNPRDNIPKRYEPIREAIIAEMNNKPLTPTHSKSHAPASHLLQARVSVKDLLTEDDLKFLVEYDDETPKWAIAASQKNSDQDRFLSGLAIKEWDIEGFVEVLKEKATASSWSDPDPDFIAWLAAKPEEWHQQLYALLYKELESQTSLKRLERIQIVRLSDGTYSIGNKCFFPSDGIEKDEVLPRVAKGIYSSGKNKTQQENTRKFLEAIGVREVGEAEQIEAILKQRYSDDAKAPDKTTYRNDLKRFIALLKKEPDRAELFADFFIFKLADEYWGKPKAVFLDLPFIDTGLSAYYEAFGDNSQRAALAKSYQDLGISIKEIVDFAKAVGAKTYLEIMSTFCLGNPKWDYLSAVPGERHNENQINCDYVVPELQSILQKPTIEISRLVWRTMFNLDEKYLRATYQKNRSGGSRSAHSQLVHLLRDAAWVPQQDGDIVSFVRPSDALPEALPKAFPFDPGQKWLEVIEFGTVANKRDEKYNFRNHQAQGIGFASADEADQMVKIAKLCRQQGKSLNDLISQLTSQANTTNPAFPQKPVTDPERRREQLSGQLDSATEKEYEKRERNVRTTRETIDPERYLREAYTVAATEIMICQICKEEMPFKKRDGEYYFEAVEALSRDHLPNEHEAQFLALCPLCAAMYKELLKKDEADMAKFKKRLIDSDSPEIPVKLDDKSTTVRFVETHRSDLKTILNPSA